MILLTHGYFLEEDAKEQLIMKPYAPLGILYISAYLDEKGIENTVFDSTFSSIENLKKEIKSCRPDIVALYTNLMTKLNVLKIVSFIKREAKEIKVILGGPEIRYYSEDYLLHGADMVVIGEGEETMAEIGSYFSLNKCLPANCTGTAFMEDGKMITNPERNLIKDINNLPFPNRKKINLDLYLNTWKKYHGKSMVSVSTMRGCPYTCKWCSRAVYGGTYRRRSPEKVVEEFRYLKEHYNPEAVWFVDDVFTISHKWLKEFTSLVKDKNVMIPYEIITRADRMNEEVLGMLKESGCFRIWVGAESGSQRIIDAMDRRVDVNKVREMIILSKKYGIEAGTFIMLGYPGETKKDIRQTIHHLQVSKPDHYTVTLAYPIKGTPLYNETRETISGGGNFSESTDRDLDFKRTHSTRYYQYALRWVHNAVMYDKENFSIRKLKYAFKSGVARILMKFA
ncbi:MAG: radical SAM protein [Bacteroidetes bacterium]|nr:radical SAM protein [Bacteroidota bacterium]